MVLSDYMCLLPFYKNRVLKYLPELKVWQKMWKKENETTNFDNYGGLGVTCLPRDPRFTGSNPAKVDGFFQDVKILSTSPPGGSLNRGSIV